MDMYDDHEVYCWYLGKPFPEEEEKVEKQVEPDAWSEEEIDRLFLGLPLLAA